MEGHTLAQGKLPGGRIHILVRRGQETLDLAVSAQAEQRLKDLVRDTGIERGQTDVGIKSVNFGRIADDQG